MTISERTSQVRTPAGGAARDRRRKLGTGILLIVGLLAGLIGLAPVAGAHHPVVAASVSCGYKVDWTSYSWSNNDLEGDNANVKIVSVGGGFTYGAMGATHHAVEDIAVMRSLPNLVVVAPGDPVEARAATRAVIGHHGPCYLRLGKAGESVVHQAPIEFELGKAIRMREGKDVTLISTGGILLNTVSAANLLAKEGIQTRLLSMHTVKPLDVEAVLAAARQTEAIFTVEEHSILGGLGSAVAEVLAEADGVKVPFKRIGLPSAFSPHIGTQEYMQERHGLTGEAIARTVTATLRTMTGTLIRNGR